MSERLTSTMAREYRENTLEAWQRGVERAIHLMCDKFGESLDIDKMAEAAFMSRNHFSRVFAKVTSVSPARFLAAIRLQAAKRLLLKTDRSVTEISLDVGYNSLGTFTRIFTDFVGFPPLCFRHLSRALLTVTVDDVARMLRSESRVENVPSITGEVFCDSPLALITAALFPTAVPRSRPLDCVCLTDTRRFSFVRHSMPQGRIFAVGMRPGISFEDVILGNHAHLHVGTALTARDATGDVNLYLRRLQPFDPPLVLAFPLILAQNHL